MVRRLVTLDYLIILAATTLLPSLARACPDCQDEKCVPFLGCACIPRIGCVISIPIPGTAPPGQLPTPVPGVSVPSPIPTPPLLQPAIAATEKAVKDIITTVDKAGKDTTATTEKAVKDTQAEVGRAAKNVEDAGNAVVHYVQKEVESEGKVLSNAQKRIREGKVVDAFWHMGTERLQATDDNAAAAAQESDLLRTVGAVAASAYGGPAGAAAYAAWLTYKQTGDANLALRVGILTGASSVAFGAAGDLPAGTTYQVAQKAVVTGAIGGLAVAAAGGNEEAIKAGFLSAGAMVLVQDGYKSYTGRALDGRASEGEAYCMTAGQDCSPPDAAMLQVDSEGNARLDMSKVDARRPAVGMKVDPALVSWKSEQSPFMTSVSRVPGIQAMAVFHDTWTMQWDNALLVKASILPAVVLTYTGTGAPYYDLIRQSALDRVAREKLFTLNDGPPIVSPAPSAPALGSPSASPPSRPSPAVATTNTPALQAVTLPRQASNISVSYLCSTGLDERYIYVETGRRKSDRSTCRIGYRRAEGSAELHSSANMAVCEVKAASIVAGAVEAGWSCFRGSQAAQATRAKRIAADNPAIQTR